MHRRKQRPRRGFQSSLIKSDPRDPEKGGISDSQRRRGKEMIVKIISGLVLTNKVKESDAIPETKRPDEVDLNKRK